MSIKRRGMMLLVRMRLERKFPIVIPVSLSVLGGTVEEAANWLGMWKGIFSGRGGYQLACDTAEWLAELIENLRNVGRFRLVEVEVPRVKVYIDLW